MKSVTMAVISDLHECEFGDGNRRLFAVLREQDPDFIVIAGDLITAKGGNCTATMDFLKRMSERWPVYYGVGNHERKVLDLEKFSEQKKRFVKGLQEAGVGLIRNEYIDIPESNIRITGLDLERYYYHKITRRPVSEKHLQELLGKADTSRYNVLLAHNPDHFEDYTAWNPDLILSGHVHGGIIRIAGHGVISPAYHIFPKYDAGLFEKNDVKMLLGRGIGSHSINMRLFNTPELLMVSLKPLMTGV
ncbi:MAG: metallophosphoesterase [Lachnospiraceae bacterium]|nr:metallophosphoesterase [Lachnospiraceae bacterium]